MSGVVVAEQDDGSWLVNCGHFMASGSAEDVTEAITEWIDSAAEDLRVGLDALRAWRREGGA